MLATPPRLESLAYRDLLGLQVFDCAPLRAVLTPTACAANFERPRDGSACQRCSVGARHAGHSLDGLASRRATRCLRCHEGAPRLIGRALCVPCFNRAREVAVGVNRKGSTPALWASRLRMAFAVVAVGRPATAGQVLAGSRTRARRSAGVVSPSWSALDRRHLWLAWLSAGEPEIRTLIRRCVPGGELVDLEIGPAGTSAAA